MEFFNLFFTGDGWFFRLLMLIFLIGMVGDSIKSCIEAWTSFRIKSHMKILDDMEKLEQNESATVDDVRQ